MRKTFAAVDTMPEETLATNLKGLRDIGLKSAAIELEGRLLAMPPRLSKSRFEGIINIFPTEAVEIVNRKPQLLGLTAESKIIDAAWVVTEEIDREKRLARESATIAKARAEKKAPSAPVVEGGGTHVVKFKSSSVAGDREARLAAMRAARNDRALQSLDLELLGAGELEPAAPSNVPERPAPLRSKHVQSSRPSLREAAAAARRDAEQAALAEQSMVDEPKAAPKSQPTPGRRNYTGAEVVAAERRLRGLGLKPVAIRDGLEQVIDLPQHELLLTSAIMQRAGARVWRNLVAEMNATHDFSILNVPVQERLIHFGLDPDDFRTNPRGSHKFVTERLGLHTADERATYLDHLMGADGSEPNGDFMQNVGDLLRPLEREPSGQAIA